VRRGEKTTTSGLADLYEEEGEPFPQNGERYALVGFDDEPVGVVEIVDARVVPASEIDEQFARDEGEGFETVEDWRIAHEQFFEREITPDTRIVAIRFKVVE
jgi:uncharacterized protein YhfF